MDKKTQFAGSGTTPPKTKATFSLMMGVAMAVICSSFQLGYNVAVMNAPANEIKDYFFGPILTVLTNRSMQEDLTTASSSASNVPEKVSDEEAYRDNMYAVAVSAFPIGGMIGSLLVGAVVKKFGRLGGLLVNNSISFVAASFLGLSKMTDCFVMVVIGRALIGIFAGLVTGVVPMYIGEISPKEWRGAIGVLNQLLITIGILVAQLFGLQGVMGNDAMWPYLFAFTAAPSMLQMLSMPLMPKSPRYLLIDQHKEDEARSVLVKLRGTDDVASDIDDIRQEADSEAPTERGQMAIVELLKERSVRWQLITIVVMMIAQQLSGFSAMFYYSNEIFKRIGIFDPKQQDIASVFVGVISLIMTFVSVAAIERAGRKSLLVGGFVLMTFCIFMMAVLNQFLQFPVVGWISYVSIACVIGYIIGFAIGPGPIPWLLTAELFCQAARPPAFMIACLVNWGCNFLIGIGFPSIVKATGPWMFLVVCAFAAIFLAIVLPETKNKTFQEINNLFANINGTGTPDSLAKKEVVNQFFSNTYIIEDSQIDKLIVR